MAIRIREEEVTRRIRHNDVPRAYKTSENLARRTKRRADIVRREQGVDIDDEILIQRAFIEVLESRSRGKSETSSRRQSKELRAAGRRYKELAFAVTDYIARVHNGCIRGASLDKLFEIIAVALDKTIIDVRYAIDIAVSKQLLRCQEASDADIDELVYMEIPLAA